MAGGDGGCVRVVVMAVVYGWWLWRLCTGGGDGGCVRLVVMVVVYGWW